VFVRVCGLYIILANLSYVHTTCVLACVCAACAWIVHHACIMLAYYLHTCVRVRGLYIMLAS